MPPARSFAWWGVFVFALCAALFGGNPGAEGVAAGAGGESRVAAAVSNHGDSAVVASERLEVVAQDRRFASGHVGLLASASHAVVSAIPRVLFAAETNAIHLAPAVRVQWTPRWVRGPPNATT